jgi:dolichol-phosphate mannosyltransferase
MRRGCRGRTSGVKYEAAYAMKAVVVVPTFNEAVNLPTFVPAVLEQAVPGLGILIVDDESPDGTGRLADDLSARSPGRVEVLHRRGQRGLGRAYVAGFCRALEEGADVVVQMDADFSHPPDDIPRLVAALADCDVAIGSRYVSGGAASEDWSPGRRALSRWANFYSRTILGLKTRDATAGFKAWRRTALEAIDLGRVSSDGYIFQVEMAYLCERLGLRVGEIPITFEERHDGRSKMTMGIKLDSVAGVFRIRRRHRGIRPLP